MEKAIISPAKEIISPIERVRLARSDMNEAVISLVSDCASGGTPCGVSRHDELFAEILDRLPSQEHLRGLGRLWAVRGWSALTNVDEY